MKRVFELLAGLNSEFEPIRAQILGNQTLPSLNGVYALLQRDERRRAAMQPLMPIPERSA